MVHGFGPTRLRLEDEDSRRHAATVFGVERSAIQGLGNVADHLRLAVHDLLLVALAECHGGYADDLGDLPVCQAEPDHQRYVFALGSGWDVLVWLSGHGRGY